MVPCVEATRILWRKVLAGMHRRVCRHAAQGLSPQLGIHPPSHPAIRACSSRPGPPHERARRTWAALAARTSCSSSWHAVWVARACCAAACATASCAERSAFTARCSCIDHGMAWHCYWMGRAAGMQRHHACLPCIHPVRRCAQLSGQRSHVCTCNVHPPLCLTCPNEPRQLQAASGLGHRRLVRGWDSHVRRACACAHSTCSG